MNIIEKESIRIKELGALKDVFLPEIRPVTVLIGESASGKSTLLKVIALMRYIYKRLNIRSYLRSSQITGKVFDVSMGKLLRDGLDQLVTDQTEIEYTIQINGHQYVVSYRNRKLENPTDILNDDLLYNKVAWVSEMRNVIPTWANKGAAVKNFSFGFYFDETYQDFNEATDVLKQVNLDYVKLNLKVEKAGNNQKKFVVTPSDQSYGPFDLKNASSGIQSTAPLMTLVQYFATEYSFKDAMQRSIINLLFEQNLTSQYHPQIELSDLPKSVLLHIEEPELSLDPESQRRLMSSIIRHAFYQVDANRNLGIVFATHSPYIINHLNVLLRASYAEKFRKDYPYLSADMIAAYKIVDGGVSNLMATDDETGQAVINTIDLSMTMEDIFNEYEALSE